MIFGVLHPDLDEVFFIVAQQFQNLEILEHAPCDLFGAAFWATWKRGDTRSVQSWKRVAGVTGLDTLKVYGTAGEARTSKYVLKLSFVPGKSSTAEESWW